MYNKVADIYCKDPNLLLSVFNEMVESGMNEEEVLSHLYAFCPTKRAALYLRSVLPISWNNIFICPETRNSKNPTNPIEVEKYIKWIKTFNNMKFDYVIQNPPYDGKRNLFVKFFNEGLDILSENGRMVIIGPSTWLINLRKGGKAKIYNELKDRVDGHVVKVNLENQNKSFGTGMKMPFATIVIDMSKTYDEIEFVCFGEKKMVKSLYDCNLVGDYATVWSILERVKANGTMMSDKVTLEKIPQNGVMYLKFDEIVTVPMGKYGSTAEKMLDLPCFMIETDNGKYAISYLAPSFSQVDGKIYEEIPYAKKRGASKELSDHSASCVYGTTKELENWKHFTLCNKLSLFLNIVLTFDQHNNSKDFLPWLVDKQYTDEEINKLFGFTDEEIALIDRTIKKYERNSPWFKRYMCGPDSVSDEEVNNFIKSL